MVSSSLVVPLKRSLKPMPPNPTPRLSFREMSMDDLDDMAHLLGDPLVMEHYPRPKDRREAAEWISWNLRNYAEHGHGLWIIESHGGEFIGDCGLTWQTVDQSPALEVGYHVKTSAQRLGYATEAATACRDYASSHVLAVRIVSIIHLDAPTFTALRVRGVQLHARPPGHAAPGQRRQRRGDASSRVAAPSSRAAVPTKTPAGVGPDRHADPP